MSVQFEAAKSRAMLGYVHNIDVHHLWRGLRCLVSSSTGRGGAQLETVKIVRRFVGKAGSLASAHVEAG